ncbi:MAG: ACP S-malonyltransferase [Spirochaetaceae bacterium]|jgi:[acyl-carrier-protein] S-malonyltransferase|nr:ACP S-malonyltransferase [Spirochaetaceae bacterium]
MTEKKNIFLFPGQGAQRKGMGIDLFDAADEAKKLCGCAAEIMNTDIRKLLAEADDETLKRSDIAQPAITLVNLSAACILKSRGVIPSACAGHSLGEYAALALCGIITAEDSLRLTARRGELMRQAALAAGGGMAAVMGLAPEVVEKAVSEWTNAGLKDLYIANYNSPRQIVISGSAAALNEAETRFKEKRFVETGIRRVIKLAVAGPFHSPLMKEAADKFAATLETVKFSNPVIPFFSNVTGKQVMSGEEAKTLALRQICGAVRWLDEETAISAMKPDAILELGPGKTLCGLWKDTGSAIPCHPAGTIEDIDKINAA